MTFNQFKENVKQWSSDRGIYSHSTSTAQLLKGISEIGELADAQAKNDMPGKIDAVGDVLVCLVNYCEMEKFTIEEAMAKAWDEIKDRKGRMIEGGTFVKD